MRNRPVKIFREKLCGMALVAIVLSGLVMVAGLQYGQAGTIPIFSPITSPSTVGDVRIGEANLTVQGRLSWRDSPLRGVHIKIEVSGAVSLSGTVSTDIAGDYALNFWLPYGNYEVVAYVEGVRSVINSGAESVSPPLGSIKYLTLNLDATGS